MKWWLNQKVRWGSRRWNFRIALRIVLTFVKISMPMKRNWRELAVKLRDSSRTLKKFSMQLDVKHEAKEKLVSSDSCSSWQAFFFVFILVLSRAQRSLAASLESFHFEWIGNNQTDDELLIAQSLQEFARLICSIEDERDRLVWVKY